MLQMVTVDARLTALLVHSRDLAYTLPSLTATALRCYSFSCFLLHNRDIQTLLTTMNLSVRTLPSTTGPHRSPNLVILHDCYLRVSSFTVMLSPM